MTTFTEHVHKSMASSETGSLSQSGEDAVISAIFELVPPVDKTCMEFGAADGLFYSNTARLWMDDGWSAILIESDPVLCEKLVQNTQGYDTVTYCSVVEDMDCFAPHPLDFVSIDVDGEDFNIWDRSSVMHRIVCIEHNPTFPPHVRFHSGQWQGASAASLVHLGASKGYRFLMASKTNCFFVREDLFSPFSRFDTSLENNFDTSSLSYVVSDFKGNFDIAGDLPYGMVWKVDLSMDYQS